MHPCLKDAGNSSFAAGRRFLVSCEMMASWSPSLEDFLRNIARYQEAYDYYSQVVTAKWQTAGNFVMESHCFKELTSLFKFVEANASQFPSENGWLEDQISGCAIFRGELLVSGRIICYHPAFKPAVARPFKQILIAPY